MHKSSLPGIEPTSIGFKDRHSNCRAILILWSEQKANLGVCGCLKLRRLGITIVIIEIGWRESNRQSNQGSLLYIYNVIVEFKCYTLAGVRVECYSLYKTYISIYLFLNDYIFCVRIVYYWPVLILKKKF